jgi:tetratricopeptide (TPR) repeat protein
MKKITILIFASIIAILAIFVFGRTTSNKSKTATAAENNKPSEKFDFDKFITSEKAKLQPYQIQYLNNIETKAKDGDDNNAKIKANEQLANFWKDSIKSFDLYSFYTSSASKLVNSEKNLTFAAQLMLEGLRNEKDLAKLNWKTDEAIDLFEKAIKLNPNSDDLKIGLGSCYIFGKGRNGNPQETMKGIQELLAVVRKDSTNMKAQLVLGIGGITSGQFDKAIPRLEKVVIAEPNNVEAIAFLADAYGAAGKKDEAIKYYNISKKLINNPEYSKEVDEHIKELK